MSPRSHVEDSLRRIGDLVKGLEKIKDPTARLAARTLFEAVLDLHGLALAKIASRLAAEPKGREIYEAIGRDEQVKAVLLLYGLHPDSAEERIRGAIGMLEQRLGVRIRLSAVEDGIARITFDSGAQDFDATCREVGAALIDAAPDMDDIVITRAAPVPAFLRESPRAAAAE